MPNNICLFVWSYTDGLILSYFNLFLSFVSSNDFSKSSTPLSDATVDTVADDVTVDTVLFDTVGADIIF